MKFAGIAASFALVASALAAPAVQVDTAAPGCLCQADAENLLNSFIQAFQHLPDVPTANQTLQKILAPHFTEISDSILSLEGRPLGGISAASKAEYIDGLLGNAATTGITTLLVAPVDCNSIIWQWLFTGVGDQKYEAKGFNLFKLNEQRQIKTLYVEFNSIAWGQDTGYTLVFPSASPASTSAAATPSATAR